MSEPVTSSAVGEEQPREVPHAGPADADQMHGPHVLERRHAEGGDASRRRGVASIIGPPRRTRSARRWSASGVAHASAAAAIVVRRSASSTEPGCGGEPFRRQVGVERELGGPHARRARGRSPPDGSRWRAGRARGSTGSRIGESRRCGRRLHGSPRGRRPRSANSMRSRNGSGARAAARRRSPPTRRRRVVPAGQHDHLQVVAMPQMLQRSPPRPGRDAAHPGSRRTPRRSCVRRRGRTRHEPRRRVRPVARARSRSGAHGVAGHHGADPGPERRPVTIRTRPPPPRRTSHSSPVRQARDRVLFVQHDRAMRPARGHHRGHADVAAHPDHDVGRVARSGTHERTERGGHEGRLRRRERRPPG